MDRLKKLEDEIKYYEMIPAQDESSRIYCTKKLEQLYKDRLEILMKNPSLESTLQPTVQPTYTTNSSSCNYSPTVPTAGPTYEAQSENKQWSQGYFTSFVSNVSNMNPWNNKGSKDKKDKKEAERFRLEMFQLEQEKKRRMERIAAEQSENNRRIDQTATFSHQRNMENFEKNAQDMKRQLDFEREKEMDRQLIKQQEEEEMVQREKAEMREMESRRRYDREEEQRRNAEWREKIALEKYRQEDLTARIINEQKESLARQQESDLQKHFQAQKDLSDLNSKYSNEREEMRDELRRMDEKVRKANEECRQKYEEMSKKSQEQLEELMRLLKQMEWSRTIEANWSNRLKALKSTDRRVYRAMSQLRKQLALVKIKDMNPEFIRRDVDRLKTEVEAVKTVMKRECENLKKMHEFSWKQFVLDIANSLHNVSDVCMNLSEYLDGQLTKEKFDKAEASSFYAHLESYEDAFATAYLTIPSIDSLKSKYSTGFQNSSSSSMAAITDDGHVVQIEEID